jgi:hypothetical protein
LALRVLADKLEHSEIVLDPAALSFATAPAA